MDQLGLEFDTSPSVYVKAAAPASAKDSKPKDAQNDPDPDNKDDKDDKQSRTNDPKLRVV
jgi:stringent starvation protein B